ncbi:hypothetical protein ACJ72_06690 [Emergomyces africanus]|uniref:PHD-type domain-containing protein n=1 Tax=Emergomyces africanus TaxID=1955775 RepID=A0A1B7NQE5_9EURO|nr:hypothetical protein ACJ72_06690 [Emergomyces africanus]
MAPISPQPNSVVNCKELLPQEKGSPTLTTSLSASTAASLDSSDRPATTDSSVANPLGIPKLSAATAELLARANGSWRLSDSDDTTRNSSNNNTGENACSTPSGSSLEMMVSTTLGGRNVEKEQAKDSLSYDDHTPNEKMSSTDMSQPQPPPPPDTSGSVDVHNAVKPNDNVTPTSYNQVSTKIVHLRNIAPRPSNLPLATTKATATRATTTTTTTTTKVIRRSCDPKRARSRKRTRKNIVVVDDDEGVIKADNSTSDESSNEATLVTTKTKSGRQIHPPAVFYPPLPVTGSGSPTGPDASSSQPRKRRRAYRKGKEMNVICKHCERGHSPTGNVIVFCDDCNRPWHQFCHDPPIEKGVVTVKELEWFCRECRPPLDAMSDEMPPPSNLQHQAINRIDTSNSLPIFPSETKVGGARFSLEQKRGYLYRLSHSHLVNLILHISDATPDFPIFPENLPDLPSSTLLPPTPQLPSTQLSMASDKPPLISGISTTSVSTLATQNSLTTPQSSVAGQPYLPPAAAADLSIIAEERHLSPKDDDAPGDGDDNDNDNDNDDDDDDDDYLYIEDHRLYPKAGNGFRLPPDSEDLDMLLEDPACTTFSHALHGPAKSRMLGTSGLPMVVGGAA